MQQSCAGRRPFLPAPHARAGAAGARALWRSQVAGVRCVTKELPKDKPLLSYVGVQHTAAKATGGMVSSLGPWPSLPADGVRPPAITKSDAAFLKSNLEFVWGTDELNLVELNQLFELVGFPKRNLDLLKKALDNTHAIVWIRCTKQSRWAKLGQLLGFARATSDKALSATVWDVAVHPAWQRGGLGRGLVERLTASLVADNIQTICLYAEPAVIGMYEKLGYVKDPHGIKGMAFQRNSPAGQAVLAAAPALPAAAAAS